MSLDDELRTIADLQPQVEQAGMPVPYVMNFANGTYNVPLRFMSN